MRGVVRPSAKSESCLRHACLPEVGRSSKEAGVQLYHWYFFTSPTLWAGRLLRPAILVLLAMGLVTAVAGATIGATATLAAAYRRGQSLQSERARREQEREKEFCAELLKAQEEIQRRPAPEIINEEGFVHLLAGDDASELHLLTAVGTTIAVGFTCFTLASTRANACKPKMRQEAWNALMQAKKGHEEEMSKFGGLALTKMLLPLLEEGGAGSRALGDALTAHGLVRHEPSLGTLFDPSKMQAVGSCTPAAVAGSQCLVVTALHKPGYSMHGEQTLAYAQVEVALAKGPTSCLGAHQ